MKIWITVSRGEFAAGAELIARTSDPALARHVLRGLYQNRVLEADRNDRIGCPDFMAVAHACIAFLTEEIREAACRCPDWEVVEEDEPQSLPGAED